MRCSLALAYRRFMAMVFLISDAKVSAGIGLPFTRSSFLFDTLATLIVYGDVLAEWKVFLCWCSCWPTSVCVVLVL